MAIGSWVVIEGLDGCGKGTLRNGLAKALETEVPGRRVTFVREPGGTELGEKLRELILRDYGNPTHPITEMMLFFAARVQLMVEVIQPALERGDLVISERNYISSCMYQGHGLGYSYEFNKLMGILNKYPTPNLYLYMDIDLTTSARRVSVRKGLDVIENRDTQFFTKVLDGYRSWARANEGRVAWIDAMQSPDKVLSDALAAMHNGINLS